MSNYNIKLNKDIPNIKKSSKEESIKNTNNKFNLPSYFIINNICYQISSESFSKEKCILFKNKIRATTEKKLRYYKYLLNNSNLLYTSQVKTKIYRQHKKTIDDTTINRHFYSVTRCYPDLVVLKPVLDGRGYELILTTLTYLKSLIKK